MLLGTMDIRFAWFLLVHKYWVFVAGIRLSVPLTPLLVHDWTKCTAAEWRRSALALAGRLSDSENAQLKAEHAAKNPHHWEHWNGREMPERFAREMVADWMGRGRARLGRWDVQEWYAANNAVIVLHPNTRALVESLIG